MTRELTEARKSDRAKMAADLARRLTALGAEVVIRAEGFDSYSKRRVALSITARHGERAAVIGVDFDGDTSQKDVHVCTWNTVGRRCFHPMEMGFHVNNYHFGKATRIGYGFEDLAAQLETDVERIVAGTAFCLEREAALLADYKARGWA